MARELNFWHECYILRGKQYQRRRRYKQQYVSRKLRNLEETRGTKKENGIWMMRRWQDNAVNLDIYLAEKEGVDDKIDVNRVHILVLRSEVQAFIGKSETGV